MKRCILCVILSLMLGCLQAQVFVSATAANDDGDGSSWETAKKNIPAALDLVGTNGVVCVKAGNYSLSAQLDIPAGVTIKGGYALSSSGTDTTHWDLPGLNSRWANASICTIITGSGNHRIATVNGLLEGCVLRRGFTNDKGGGVLIDNGMVRYCVIKECDAINENTMMAEGGGVYIRNNGLLTNCVVTECRGDKGPAVSGGNGSLINNTITRNWPTHCGTVADYDGNVYNTVVIGQQCWTRQNMRSMHYNDGSVIQRGTENSVRIPYYYVNYNALTASMLPNYGYLYNWIAAMHGAPSSSANPSGVTGICPLGWHLPSDSEYVEMKEFVNTILANRCGGYDYQIAKSLSSRTGWPSASGCQIGNNQATNNNTLFSAYPAGYYDNGFSSLQWANFWTTSQNSNGNPVSYYMNYNDAYLNKDENSNSARARSVRCVMQLTTVEPVVHTAAVVVLSSTSAQCGGNSSDGGTPITDRGICWNSSPNPTLSNSHVSMGIGEGGYTATMNGLTAGTTYYVRAYIVNANGTFYGEERTFVPGNCGDMVFTDIDGNNYHTIQMGEQCWMRENLRTTHYANGDIIPTNTDYSYDDPFYYQNAAVDVSAYGLYYNWPAVMHGENNSDANPSGVQGVCPTGWHVPSNAEFEQLKTFVSSQNEYICNGNPDNIAKALASTTDWNTSSTLCHIGNNQDNNNATGFNVVPTGYRGSGESYYNPGVRAYFWTTSVNDGNSSYPVYRRLDYNSAYFNFYYTYSQYEGFSVRCVKND